MCKTFEEWHVKFQELMSDDIWAPGAILGYALTDKDAECIMCPWGEPEYERIGKMLKDDDIMISAASQVGFLVTAIAQYLSSALDNFDNWVAMKPGVLYLMDNPVLRSFVPYEDRYAVDWLKDIDDEDEWYENMELYCSERKDRCFKGLF